MSNNMSNMNNLNNTRSMANFNHNNIDYKKKIGSYV